MNLEQFGGGLAASLRSSVDDGQFGVETTPGHTIPSYPDRNQAIQIARAAIMQYSGPARLVLSDPTATTGAEFPGFVPTLADGNGNAVFPRINADGKIVALSFKSPDGQTNWNTNLQGHRV